MPALPLFHKLTRHRTGSEVGLDQNVLIMTMMIKEILSIQMLTGVLVSNSMVGLSVGGKRVEDM